MCTRFRPFATLVCAAALACPWAVQAQSLSQYSLRLGPELRTGAPGGGLSFEAGDKWFARLGVANTLDNEHVSLGGGYRLNGSESLSMQVLRGPTPQRLGLAVRYDWPSYYLRLSYDRRWSDAATDKLHFSAGMRF